MSLRGALASLPDDRATRSAARSVVFFLTRHAGEPLDADRIARVTGVSRPSVELVLKTFAESYVIDCVGPLGSECTYNPSAILSLEVDRFLRSTSTTDRTLRDGTDKFRARFGR